MQYISIDIETTGLDPSKDQILEFAAIVDDLTVQAPIETLPTFHVYCSQQKYSGDAYALWMNASTLEILAKGSVSNIIPLTQLSHQFYNWLRSLGITRRWQPAGKNAAGFDCQFLGNLPSWDNLHKMNHNVLDPTMLYYDSADSKLPSL